MARRGDMETRATVTAPEAEAQTTNQELRAAMPASPPRLHPGVKTRADLGVAGGIGVDAVVFGITIEGIEVQLGGHEVDVVGFATAELLEHALHEAMLNALPAPAGIFVLVVGRKAGLSRIRRGGEADGEQRLRRGFAKLGEESFSIGKHLGDLGIGRVGIGGEAVIDAEEEADDIGRLALAVFAEVARKIEDGLLGFISKEEGTGALPGEWSSGDASRLGVELGEEIGPLPSAVAFVANVGRGTGGLVGADEGALGIAGLGEPLGDFVGIQAGVREAVAHDEEAQGFALASVPRRDVEGEAAALDDATMSVLHGNGEGMIADVFVGGCDGPATCFVGAKRALELEAVVLRLFGEDDVVVVKTHRHIRCRIKNRRQGELELARKGCGGEKTGNEQMAHGKHTHRRVEICQRRQITPAQKIASEPCEHGAGSSLKEGHKA